MDIVFNCPFCSQELSVDETGAGAEIPCPSCNEVLLVPSSEFSNLVSTPEEAAAAAPAPTPNKDTRSIGRSAEAAAPAQILKPNRPLEATAKGDKKPRLKTFRRQDFVKDGKDRFDEAVSEFPQKTGEDNFVEAHAISYSYVAKEGNQVLTDYGVVVVYKS